MGTESLVHPPFTTGLLPSSHSVEKQKKWRKYLDEGNGTYESKKGRYQIVAAKLIDMGLTDDSQITDLGAGRTWFDYYLRTEIDWKGAILNVDAVLDGENLETWWPRGYTDYTVCIETIEHLSKPGELLAKWEGGTELGMIFTTPNPETVDIKSLDSTHISPIYAEEWKQMYYEIELHSLYQDDDTILAWKDMTL